MTVRQNHNRAFFEGQSAYDALNRMVQGATFSGGSDNYGYSADDNRVWKQEPTTLNYGEIHFFGAFRRGTGNVSHHGV